MYSVTKCVESKRNVSMCDLTKSPKNKGREGGRERRKADEGQSHEEKRERGRGTGKRSLGRALLIFDKGPASC